MEGWLVLPLQGSEEDVGLEVDIGIHIVISEECVEDKVFVVSRVWRRVVCRKRSVCFGGVACQS